MSTVEANETSPRKFNKPWGTQTVVHSNRDFETHLIEIKQGGKTSIHVHRGKHNGWFVIEGEVVVRPIMYLALSYDHRIIDGKSSVGFLCKVKECLEDPQQYLMNNNIQKALEI